MNNDDDEEVYGDRVDDMEIEREEEEDIKIGQKRQRIKEIKDMRKLKRQKRQKIMRYYRGIFYGKSTASTIYELSRQLNKDSKDFLWYRILGLTD